MRNEFLIFGSPQIEQAEIDEVLAVLKSRWLGTGPRVAAFETAFQKYVGTGHAAAVSSCTAGLHLSLVAMNLKPGDEVITTPMTFCATVNAIIHSGAIPILADVDPKTMNIDPAAVREKIGPRTRALLPVHFAGRPCNMDALAKMADEYGLTIIEDCAHAIETEYKGKKAGTFGRFGCFSFYVTKNVATGEGGMILSRAQEDHDLVKILSLHGMTKDAWKRFGGEGFRHYQVVAAGYKYNMMDLQAAIGLHQLARVEVNWRRRSQIWERYMHVFANLPIDLPAVPEPETRHAHHLFTVLVDETKAGITRDAFLDAMNKQKIGTGVHYLSVAEHPYYRERFGWHPEEWPNALAIGRNTVSLPLSPALTDSDVDDVIEAINRILKQ
jgi:dTDP-4-amino-4,6-dideoxygalactose transaminase